ncbi:hypothetical protein BDU57DRAFT_230663 [Ampelomyces quisqualis]|uniref:Uncharacterized protein n=1 Tax=Ampelomyces quisqualis TaxID=50730 RepID=A0A6A5QNG7_AMPQU|nr:hypothetical protein BDU57DRAFT_230663 [Ampelomyces quisqualis]
MSHKPTCPYYHEVRLPACTCLPHAPVQTYLTRHSSALRTPQPLYPSAMQHAVQSTRLIQRSISQDHDLLNDTAKPAPKHVHFRAAPRLTLPRNKSDDNTMQRVPAPQPPPRILTPHSFIPTIYIVTFATDTYPLTHAPTIARLVTTQVPRRNPPIPHLYTLSCHSFTPPPQALCAVYSGIAPLIQDIVLCDPGAARAVRAAVRRLLDEGRRGVRECSMSVCCHAGTHRSVAVGERIAQGVKGEVKRVGGEVRVVVRHVSRVRGRGEEF